MAVVEKGAVQRFPALTGRCSKAGLYAVLPFRMEVTVEASYAAELVRRLKNSESFITVEGVSIRPVLAKTLGKVGSGLLASTLEDYGTQGVVRLEVVGETLVFQLEGGRITTMPKAVATTFSSGKGP